jgi:GDPmannose 4,6-dehydratase
VVDGGTGAIVFRSRLIGDYMTKVALVTGVTGQDGSYLCELLLQKGYEVHGLVRRSSSFNTARIDHLYQDPHEDGRKLVLHHADLDDGLSLVNILRETGPSEVYNLGAQSHVRVSYDTPLYTANVTGVGALRILEAVRASNLDIRVYQASSSEMFGSTPPPQNEETPFHPRSPYACAKVYAYWSAVNHRESYGMYVSNGILFNHESPRRGETFVTRKITRAVARIQAGLQKELYLGNLDATRDWGYAPEYVQAMWMMLQAPEPDDYVVATGTTYSVREFCQVAFGHVGLNWEDYVRFDPKYTRPAEVDALMGDASKIRTNLGWKPEVNFEELVQIMVDGDIQLLEDERSGRLVRVDR